jgi:hypothetical protein
MSCSERTEDTRAGDQRLFTPLAAAPMLVSRPGGAMAGKTTSISMIAGLLERDAGGRHTVA